MASSARTVMLLLCGLMALLHYAGVAPTYSQRIEPSELPGSTYLIPAVFSHSHAATPPPESTSLKPAEHVSYSSASTSDGLVLKTVNSTEDHLTGSMNSWDAVLPRSEACDESTRPPKRAPARLDWYHGLVSTPAGMAPAGKASGSQRQTYTATVDLEPSTNPAAVVEAVRDRKERLESVMEVSQPDGGVGTPLWETAHTGPSVDPGTFRESVSEYTPRSHVLLAHIARAPSRKRTRTQQTHVAESEGEWPTLTPAHAVEEFLHYSDDSDCRGETHALDVADNQTALYNVDGECIPEQAERAKDEPCEVIPAKKRSPQQQDAGGRDGQAAGAVNENVSQYHAAVQDNPGKSVFPVSLDCPPGRNVPREGAQEQSSGSGNQADTQQVHRQRQQREQQEQQRADSGVGAALRRRLATPPFRQVPQDAEQALQGLYGAQREVGSLIAEAEQPGSVERPSRTEKQLQSGTNNAPSGRARGSRVARSTRRTRSAPDSAKAETESVSSAYHRYLQEEARALGYDPSKWEGDSFKDFAVVGALALIGQPLWALSAMSFTVLDRLLHLDSVLEQHTIMHLRARRRLIRQFLKDAKKEQEQHRSTAPSKEPGEGAAGHLRLDPATYKFLSTNVLNVIAEPETVSK